MNEYRYCGRVFTAKEMDWIRNFITANPDDHRLALSRIVCQEFQWLRPDGRLKDMSCRVAMLRMHRDGLIPLPLIVNNAGFLILPWVTSKNLASRILARVAKQLPDDWQTRYHYFSHTNY